MRSSVLVAVCAGMAVLLLATAPASATADRWGLAQYFGPGNPAASTLRLGTMAPRIAMSYGLGSGMNNMLLAAADDGAEAGAAAPEGEPVGVENPWFHHPKPFLEYHYGSNRDRRRAGLDSDLNGGTVGLMFGSVGNSVGGIMYDYTHSEGTSAAGASANVDTNSLTLFLGNNIDMLFFGTSMTFGDSAVRTRLVRRVHTDINTFSVAPYVGLAAYQQGPLTVTSTLTMVWRWQDFNYDWALADDDSSDGTLVLMNRATYALTQQAQLVGIFDWNRVLQEEETLVAPIEDPDRCWFTLGAKLQYRLMQNVDVYAQYTSDVGNESYENHQVNMGISFSF